jgi:hypothetical protein
MTAKSSRPPEATPGLAGLNVVRPRADALRALHVDPRRGTSVNWHLPGNPPESARRPGWCGAKTSRACQGSTEADPSRIK